MIAVARVTALSTRRPTPCSIQIFATIVTGIALFFAGSLRAAEITGTVQSVSCSTAIIETSGGTPAVGDSVDIFFKLAGKNNEISVASGKVIGKEAGGVKVKIEKSHR